MIQPRHPNTQRVTSPQRRRRFNAAGLFPLRFGNIPVWMLTGLVLISVFGCKRKISTVPVKPLSPEEQLIASLIQGEDLILDLTPRLGQIAIWLQEHSQDPAVDLADDLATCQQVVGLAAADLETLFHLESNQPTFLQVAHWPIESSPSQTPKSPWEASDSLGVHWETLKFGVVSSEFTDQQHSKFDLHTKIEGHGKDSTGRVYGMKGHQIIGFTQVDDQWKLTAWTQEDFFAERCPTPMFREVLAEVVPDAETLSNAQRSFQDEIVVKTSQRGRTTLMVPKHSDFATLSSNHAFPSVSVVDYNNDGREDLFLTARWGPTQMLEKQEDGTYVDVAEKIGLLEENLVNCVLFVDLDNDGDQDAVMGRAMEPVKILFNEDGHYRDRTNRNSDLGKQYFISAVCAIDVNRDGLLDLYLSNYPPLNKPFENVFLNDFERTKYLEKAAHSNPFLDLASSSNVMLMNRGSGQLERVPYDDLISQWRRSFQAVAADIDDDGDDDLYICNDFASDSLLRNDTPRGAEQPVFVDVLQELVEGGVQGSAMGGSWGDFDQDGDLDLYISNMFSKAGNRIIKQIGSVDPRIRATAAGNFLFENNQGKFQQRAGSEEGQFHINQIGWSYGGQWADFNNDSRLDLYVPSGFYTAPKEIETQVDT